MHPWRLSQRLVAGGILKTAHTVLPWLYFCTVALKHQIEYSAVAFRSLAQALPPNNFAYRVYKWVMALRNIAVVWRPEDVQGRPSNLLPADPTYRDTTGALYSKALDLLKSPRGQWTMRTLVRYWLWGDGGSVAFNDPRLTELVDIFYDKVESTSPLLVIDSSIQSPQLIGMHPRGSWEGEFRQFDPRRQALLVNKVVSRPFHVRSTNC